MMWNPDPNDIPYMWHPNPADKSSEKRLDVAFPLLTQIPADYDSKIGAYLGHALAPTLHEYETNQEIPFGLSSESMFCQIMNHATTSTTKRETLMHQAALHLMDLLGIPRSKFSSVKVVNGSVKYDDTVLLLASTPTSSVA